MASIGNVSLTYQQTNAAITGDNAGDQPTLDTVLVKITGGTVATGDNLKFYALYSNDSGVTTHPISWTYTVLESDDFVTAGVPFTVDPLLEMTVSTQYTAGKVYDGSIWNF